jgi:hypothetical protein
MRILLTIPDDYQPENSDIPEENNPFAMVRAALEHFEIPSEMLEVRDDEPIEVVAAPDRFVDLVGNPYGIPISVKDYDVTTDYFSFEELQKDYGEAARKDEKLYVERGNV